MPELLDGGNYGDNGNNVYYNASSRGSYHPNTGSYGFRVALYLKENDT